MDKFVNMGKSCDAGSADAVPEDSASPAPALSQRIPVSVGGIDFSVLIKCRSIKKEEI